MSVEQSLLVSAITVLVAFTPTVGGQGLCGSASLTATASGQNLTSPGYPTLYPNDFDCQWNISGGLPSNVIVLDVLDLVLEGSPPACQYDYVAFYDGASAISPRIQLLCGAPPGTEIISTGSSMTVVFHSDSSNTYRGFQFEYKYEDRIDLCRTTNLLATAIGQNITSSGYPYKYQNNMSCEWNIEADSQSSVVVLSVLDFELEGSMPGCSFDYVAVYDGASTSSPRIQLLCGVLQDSQIIGTGPFMTVVFRSDVSNIYRGFQLEYRSDEKSDLCSVGNLSATVNVSYITSPAYPDSYPSNMDCQWTIVSTSDVIVIKLLDFYMDGYQPSCQNDYVAIYDGPTTNSSRIQVLCGQVPNTQFISSGAYMTVVFHSDGSSNYRGFRLEYTSQEKADVCSDVSLLATETAHYFTSTNYPNNYLSNQDCRWSISADSSSRVVVLKLLDFYIEGYSPNCLNDYVVIYDGYSTSSPRIHLLCGAMTISLEISTGPYMTVVFHSDLSATYRGFKFEYTSQEKSDLCTNITLSATETVQYITSPGYPNNYPSNTDCQWSIHADTPSRVLVFNVSDFDVEESSPTCTYDYLAVYDGPSTSSPRTYLLCGQISNTQFTSIGRSVIVVFHSDESTNFKGFKIGYNSHESATCTSVTATANGTAQYVTSPGYPNDYPSSTNCQWSLSADINSSVVVLKALDFLLEGTWPSCNYDYLAVYDGPSTSSPRIQLLCDGADDVLGITSSGPSMVLAFHSDGSNNYRGFKFEYTSQEKADLCTNVTISVTGVARYITSPGYPNNYPSTRSCQWTFVADTSTRVVVLKVLDFELEGSSPSCTFDYVAVYDGSSTDAPRTQLMCGQVSSLQVISTGPSMTVVFYADGSTNFKGFKLEYNSQESALCANVNLQATETEQILTSPGYPGTYPSNMGCQWSISAFSSTRVVVLTLSDFETEGSMPGCTYDYVAAYDGASTSSPRIQLLCGQIENMQIRSTGPLMTVVFRSDGAINYKGFSLVYTSQ